MSELVEVLAHVAKVPPETVSAWLEGAAVPVLDDLALAAVAIELGVEGRVGWSNMRRKPCPT